MAAGEIVVRVDGADLERLERVADRLESDRWWQAYLAALTGLASQAEPSRHRDPHTEERVTRTAAWLADASVAALSARAEDVR